MGIGLGTCCCGSTSCPSTLAYSDAIDQPVFEDYAFDNVVFLVAWEVLETHEGTVTEAGYPTSGTYLLTYDSGSTWSRLTDDGIEMTLTLGSLKHNTNDHDYYDVEQLTISNGVTTAQWVAESPPDDPLVFDADNSDISFCLNSLTFTLIHTARIADFAPADATMSITLSGFSQNDEENEYCDDFDGTYSMSMVAGSDSDTLNVDGWYIWEAEWRATIPDAGPGNGLAVLHVEYNTSPFAFGDGTYRVDFLRTEVGPVQVGNVFTVIQHRGCGATPSRALDDLID